MHGNNNSTPPLRRISLVSHTVLGLSILFSQHVKVSTSFSTGHNINKITCIRSIQQPTYLKAQISDEEEFKSTANAPPTAKTSSSDESTIATKTTINDRLLAEVQREVYKTKTGGAIESNSSPRSTKKFAFRYGPEKSDEERSAALAEAQNLNGVEPWSTILSSFFALGMAFGVWTFTTYLGEVFASHPITTEVYFLVRLQSVFRSLIMGLFSLMSGFFGVNGLGILFLGVRVAYGVLTGELDPTPRASVKTESKVKMSNVWEFMTMDKRKRIGKKNLFDDL